MDPTGIVLLGVLVLLLALEGWAILNKRKGDTISENVRRASLRYPVILFLAGFLMGHWFWPLCL